MSGMLPIRVRLAEGSVALTHLEISSFIVEIGRVRAAQLESDVAEAMTLQRYDMLDHLCIVTTDNAFVPDAVASMRFGVSPTWDPEPFGPNLLWNADSAALKPLRYFLDDKGCLK